MKILNTLRRVETSAPTYANICAKLKHQGYQPQPRRPLSGSRYLRFYGQFEDSAEINGLLEISSWATSALPELDGIDWFSMEDQVLQSLIAEHPLHLALSHQHAPLAQTKTLGLVVDVNNLSDLPCLDASPGAIMVEQFTPQVAADVSEIASLNNIQIPLVFSIGHSILTLSAMDTIEVGDVLLIEHVQGRVTSNGVTLFLSELNQKAIMILDRTEDGDEPHATSGEDTAGLNSLPIELSVVLMEKTVPLNQFKAITPGEIIELPAEAMLNVEVRANQRCFARGELVQLANGQLGVEIRTLWSQE